jgi:putative transposase
MPHLVVHRGHNGQAAFIDDADRSAYLQALSAIAPTTGVAVHGYGLRANELRLLVTPETERSLAEMMQAVGRRYVHGFNLRHRRSSSPWEGRFRSTVIEAESSFLTALLVVESLGTVTVTGYADASDWSSASHHLGRRVDPLVTEHAGFWKLGNTPFEREDAYRRLVDRGVSSHDADRVVNAALKGWALGTREFIDRLGAQTGRRVQALRRGRPVKVQPSPHSRN